MALATARRTASMPVCATISAEDVAPAASVTGAASRAVATVWSSIERLASMASTDTGRSLGLNSSTDATNHASAPSRRSSRTSTTVTRGASMRGPSAAHAASMQATTASARRAMTRLDVEAEVHYVAVVHDVVLALEAHASRLAGALLAVAGDVIVVRDHFGADEAALEVGMDRSGGLRRGRADRHRPGAHFLLARGEVRLQAEQLVRGTDQAIEPRLGHAHVGQEERLVVGVEIGDLRLERGADGHDGRVLA